MARIIPKGSKFWDSAGPQIMVEPQEVQKAYEEGWVGAYNDPEEHEALLAENQSLTGYADIESAASDFGWAGSGQGKLSIPFVHVIEQYPKCWPGPAQVIGDCVSQAAKNAGLGSMMCEVVAGEPDEVSGKREEAPEVSALGIRQGVFSTEAIYWWRGHSGDGWYCSAAARVMQKSSGLWIRQNYPELGIDLTRYSGKVAHKWGRTAPQGKVASRAQKNLVRAFAEAKSADARRDAINNGYFGLTCGMESWSNKRDSYGVSERTRAGWAHAMATIAFDDRPEIVRRYGGPLELILNSWGIWNSGPRDIWDSAKYVPSDKKQLWIELGIVNAQTGNIMIPHGAFWARSRDTARREWLAVSSVNGWPKKNLENWGWTL